ncbi:Transcription factor tau subunit sfc1 [Lachnellula suecica]|uniref:Transcription factor tau subunit sfc1 n=1 Tax=Lachnellula suecica TaxID=602035 RepID=A0A8T9BZZ4_9HELO|nr:Transcription factor tau subunit sfc1 [Lachnellula suecica]
MFSMPRADAAACTVPPRKVVAVEHPMIVKNLEKGIKTFGTNRPFERVLDTSNPEECVPLYIRHDDPMCIPILSNNASTNNVLLKITVPKRIGRKRKRGGLDPIPSAMEGFSPLPESRDNESRSSDSIRSQSRKDNPVKLLRTLKDNVGNYSVEAVAEITNTHRFRGLSDFHFSTSNTEFFSRFRDTVLTGNVDKLKEFQMDPSRGWKPNDQFMPPPRMTNNSIPFNWNWHQAAHIYSSVDPDTGKSVLESRAKPRDKVIILPPDAPKVPDRCLLSPTKDPDVISLIASMREALEERPIWTQRAMKNRLPPHHKYRFKLALPYVCYRFRNGPWRDALIKFGLDPRTDPKYRIYQTLVFQIRDDANATSNSHIFDGKNLSANARAWQVCDVTDPLLSSLIGNANCRYTCDSIVDGWFHNGLWAKVKAIMRTKIVALRVGKQLPDQEFAIALSLPDHIPGKTKTSRTIHVPTPDIGLTVAEFEALLNEGAPREQGARKKDYAALGKALAPKKPQSDVQKRYIQGLWDMSAETPPQTPDNRAEEAARQMSSMGMLPQGEISRSGSNTYAGTEGPGFDGEIDEEDFEDEDDEDAFDRESDEEGEDETDG